MKLVEDYFEKTKQLKQEYGEKSIVLMQVGAFYEVYGVLVNGKYKMSNIYDFSNKCGLSISEKKICVGDMPVVMSGFRDYTLDKYLVKLQNLNYTISVWSQDEKAAGTTRSLTGIYSPGTYFDSEPISITNNTTCVWLNNTKKHLVVGISNIDIYTGKSHIFEYEIEYNEDPTPYDELERFLSIFNPNELIFCYNLPNTKIRDIINYLGLQGKLIHEVDLNDQTPDNINVKNAQNCEQQIYQKQIIEKFFGSSVFINSQSDFMQYQLATQSYCYLLEFIYKHNPNLVDKIMKPMFENCSDKMILANHSLKQLNIIDNGSHSGNISSVSAFLNKCVTPMGKRKLRYNLLNPTTDIDILNKEYNICEHIIKESDISCIRSKLTMLSDIEKLYRKLLINKITPQEISYLTFNLLNIKELYSELNGDHIIQSYFLNDVGASIIQDCEEIRIELFQTLDIEKCKTINTLVFDENFIMNNMINWWKHKWIRINNSNV